MFCLKVTTKRTDLLLLAAVFGLAASKPSGSSNSREIITVENCGELRSRASALIGAWKLPALLGKDVPLGPCHLIFSIYKLLHNIKKQII